jgi:hypothetical protein
VSHSFCSVFSKMLTSWFSACDTMPSLVQPLLDGLEDYTEMTYVLIGVRAPQKDGGQFEVIS